MLDLLDAAAAIYETAFPDNFCKTDVVQCVEEGSWRVEDDRHSSPDGFVGRGSVSDGDIK